MSFLTKFFIVLHVVLTMLVVAGVVVFVNRVDEFSTANKALTTERDAARADADQSKVALEAERATRQAVTVQAGNEVGRVRAQLNAAQATIRERDTAMATQQQNLASADARLQATTAALATAQGTVDLLQKQIDQSRQASDKVQQQNTELLTANADLNSRLQVALRNLRNANEELENARNEIAGMQDRGGRPAAAADDATGGTPTPTGVNTELAINGVIRERRDINGVPYATISVGARDNVTRGMVFNVIDRQGAGDWLGTLTVDRVEDREATGRLTGPRVADIRANAEVRTQL